MNGDVTLEAFGFTFVDEMWTHPLSEGFQDISPHRHFTPLLKASDHANQEV